MPLHRVFDDKLHFFGWRLKPDYDQYAINIVYLMINCIFLVGGLYLTRIDMQCRQFLDKLHIF